MEVLDNSESDPGSEPMYQPTFATGGESLDLHIGQDTSFLTPPRNRADFKEFYHSVVGIPKPSHKPQRTIVNHSPKWRNSSGPTPIQSEIQRLADRAMLKKSIPLDDVNTMNAVLEELNTRRLAALQTTEYIKSKQIGDIIENLKKLIRQKDRESMHQEEVEQAKFRCDDAFAALDQCRESWKAKRTQLLEDFKNETADLSEKHQSQRDDLQYQWQDPTMVRKFTKRSPQLLQIKAVEKYMVLLGQLEEAEAAKRQGIQTEKMETNQKFQIYTEAFESAQAQMLLEHSKESSILKAEQEMRIAVLDKDEKAEILVCQKRISALERELADAKDIDKFVAKKYKKSSDTVLPLSTLYPGENDLPTLKKKQAPPSAKETVVKPEPLQLPPLKMKPHRNKT